MALPSTINKIRYLKRDELTQEAAIISNYYRDIIESYGVDIVYYMQDTNFPTCMSNSISSYENIIYGENTNMSYSISADMVVFLEVESDLWNVKREGTLPEDHYTMAFMIDEFASTFAQYIGEQEEFNTVFDVSGVVENFITTLSSEFSIDGLSGDVTMSIDLSGEPNGIVNPTAIYYNDPSYTIPINQYITHPTYYTVSGGDYLCSFNGAYTSNLDLSGNGTINTTINGSLLYSSTDSVNKYVGKIRPNVGDYIKIDFPGEDQFEEYEITHVWDRQLTDDGVNPLLHKYIYKMDMVRRIPDHNETENEKETNDLYNVMKREQEVRASISDNIDDYDDDVDDVYGGYGQTLDDYESDIISISIQGVDTIFENISTQYLCESTNCDGVTEYVTPQWSVTQPSTIDSSGLFNTGELTESIPVTITATYGGVETSRNIMVIKG